MRFVLDKHDLVFFGVRMASEHINAGRSFQRLEVRFSDEGCHRQPSFMDEDIHTLLFDEHWLEVTSELDVLSVSFHMVYVAYHQAEGSEDRVEEAAKQYSETMLQFFNDVGCGLG